MAQNPADAQWVDAMRSLDGGEPPTLDDPPTTDEQDAARNELHRQLRERLLAEGGNDSGPPLTDDPLATDEWDPTYNPALWAYHAGQLMQCGLSMASALREARADTPEQRRRVEVELRNWQAALYRFKRWMGEA